MDAADKQSIMRNLVELERQTNLPRLLSKLREKGVLSERMVERYRCNRAPEILKRELYLEIQTRGPSAFRELVTSLIETGHIDLARLLNPDVDIEGHMRSLNISGNANRSEHRVVPTAFPEYLVDENPGFQHNIRTLAFANPNYVYNLTTRPLVVSVRQGTLRYDKIIRNIPVYPMGSRPKGYFLMINNIQFVNNTAEYRRGAEIDEQNLQALFEGLGYRVIHARNLGLTDMRRKIKDFSEMREHSKVDSCVVAIMSHGDQDETVQSDGANILTSDQRRIPVSEVLDYFNNRNCPNLQVKPKIFIFQTCRGVLEDYGVKTVADRRTATDGVASTILRTHSDMLLAWSTLPGYASFRDKYLGTWYIQTICQIFMENAHDTPIDEMLVMVNNVLSNRISESNTMQTSSFENRGFQKFYFTPGLYDDDINGSRSNGELASSSSLIDSQI